MNQIILTISLVPSPPTPQLGEAWYTLFAQWLLRYVQSNKNMPTYIYDHDYTSHTAYTFFVFTLFSNNIYIYSLCFVQISSHAVIY